MGFWDKMNTELKKAAQDGWEAVKGSARAGKLHYNKHSLNKKAEKRFAEIGGIVYDMAEPPWENPLSRPAVLKLIEEIKKIEGEIAVIEDKIEGTVRKEEAGGAGEATGAAGAEGAGGAGGAGGGKKTAKGKGTAGAAKKKTKNKE